MVPAKGFRGIGDEAAAAQYAHDYGGFKS
jgi:hypothetical protein